MEGTVAHTKREEMSQKSRKPKTKYHSFAIGQAKREHMTRNRLLRNGTKEKSAMEIDHLSSVKNRLLGLKMMA